MLPTLQRVAGDGLNLVPKVTGSEDFSFFQRVVPGLFVFIGVTPPGTDPKQAAPNHSPRFYVDEARAAAGRAHAGASGVRLPRGRGARPAPAGASSVQRPGRDELVKALVHVAR